MLSHFIRDHESESKCNRCVFMAKSVSIICVVPPLSVFITISVSCIITSTNTYIYLYINIYIYNIYIHIDICVCVCVCIYIYNSCVKCLYIHIVIHHMVSIAKNKRSLAAGLVFLFLGFLPAEGEAK